MPKEYVLDINQLKYRKSKAVDDREVCFYLLYEVFETEAFSNLAVKDGKMSDFTRAMFYGTITYAFSIDFLVHHIAKKETSEMDPMIRTIIRMGVWQIAFSDKVPPFAAVDTSVELARKTGCGKACSYINAVLRKIASAPKEVFDMDSYKPEVALSLKPEIYGIFKKDMGKEKALLVGKALLKSPMLCIRVNTLLTTKLELIDSLTSEGIRCKESSFIPETIIIETSGVLLSETKAFKDGWFFVQNEAASLVGLLAAPKEGDKVLDCCAAPGGKSTHMAEISKDKAEILALDINESRLKLIDENAKRLHISSVKSMKADSTALNFELKLNGIKEESFDVVLTDVPCSGLGIMGRKPDIRQSISFDRISELLPTQERILKQASSFVKVGGRLIYSTCTLNKAENQMQVKKFLEGNDNFKPVDINGLLPEKLVLDEIRVNEAKEGMITLYPDTDMCDGFFAAVLERVK